MVSTPPRAHPHLIFHFIHSHTDSHTLTFFVFDCMRLFVLLFATASLHEDSCMYPPPQNPTSNPLHHHSMLNKSKSQQKKLILRPWQTSLDSRALKYRYRLDSLSSSSALSHCIGSSGSGKEGTWRFEQSCQSPPVWRETEIVRNFYFCADGFSIQLYGWRIFLHGNPYTPPSPQTFTYSTSCTF